MYGEGSTLESGGQPCIGCLNAGRRMVDISDYWRKQYFIQIISEIPACHPEGEAVRLCWECAARLAAAVAFRQQVKSCYRTLRDGAQKLDKRPPVAAPPRLRTARPRDADLSLGGTDPDCDPAPAREVKTEDAWDGWGQPKAEDCDLLKTEFEISASPEQSFTQSDDEELKYLVTDSENSRKKREKSGEEKSSKRKRSGRKEKFKVVTLSEEEMLEERRQTESSAEFLGAAHKCERCLVVFGDGERLEQHLKGKHSAEQGAYRCATCDCAFRAPSPLRWHAARHRRRYQCGRCAARHASRRRAALHRARCDHSTEKVYKTPRKKKEKTLTETEVTGDAFAAAEADELTGGAEEITVTVGAKSTSSFPCEQCSKVFRWKTSLRKHAELHRIQSGQKKPPYCDACRLSFTTTSNYQKHVKTSSKHQIQLKVRKLKELLKDEPSDQLAPIEEIRTSVQNALNKFACPHCDKKFQWKGNLLRHIQSHKARANGELHCAPCDRKFSSIATYQQHMRISKKHVTENDFRYMCSDCGRKFANKTRLKDHVDWEHLKVFTHTCPLCQKVFKSNTSLYLHRQVVHRKDNGDHLCDHCGKPFPNRAKLRGHITAMHTSEQPYECKLCVATFSWHSCLSRHVKVVHHKIKTKRKRKGKDEFAAPAHAPHALAAS